MQQFLMDYGLWLLVAALIVIAIVFLLTRGEGAGTPAAEQPLDTAKAEAMTMEPIAAAIAPIAPEPAETAPEAPAPADEPAPQTAMAAPAGEEADDLLRMKGVGPKLNARLIELGVTRFSQIAAWSAADMEAVDAQLGAFKGRPVRDQWIDQARYLANGDVAGFEAKYGRL